MTSRESNQESQERCDVFVTTHWSVVLTAGAGEDTRAMEALQSLCQTYWYPLYVYARRRGAAGAEDAEDLVQEFFASLFRTDSLRRVDRGKGRFRAFLLASFKHFLANDWDKRRAQKRGGDRTIVSIDAGRAEAWFQLEPVDPVSPEQLFERRWALTLLDRVQEQLREEYVRDGQQHLFEVLKPALTGRREIVSAAAGQALGLNEGAVRVAAHRMRKRYRELLRREIAQTVGSAAAVEDEIRHLFAVFS